jgi:hypothetical protein
VVQVAQVLDTLQDLVHRVHYGVDVAARAEEDGAENQIASR